MKKLIISKSSQIVALPQSPYYKIDPSLLETQNVQSSS